MIDRRSTSLSAACAALIALGAAAAPVGPGQQRGHDVAPNTLITALDRAMPSIVKLYGSGIGREHSYGTGVLVSADGQVVSTTSLLLAGRNLRATLHDGRTFPAKLIREDEYRQIALLQVLPDGDTSPGKLPYLTPASTDRLRIGDPVVALGNWYKVADGPEAVSVNRGIISARVSLRAQRLTQDFGYEGTVLLYDAITSNPGAPGGALVDLDGNFVGLIGRVTESSDTLTRLNWALPGEEVAAFLGGRPSPALRTGPAAAASGSAGAVPDLGIKLSRLGFRHVSAYVERVRPGSPAADAGVRPDDLILSFDGRRITDADSFEEALGRAARGRAAPLILKRGNQVIQTTILVGTAP